MPAPTVALDAALGTRSRDAVVDTYRRHVNSGFARLAELMGVPVEVGSRGCLVYSDDGDTYLDCGGYGVFFVGHGHPAVVAAVTDQLAHPLGTRVLLNPVLAAAAERLASVTPPGLDYVCFTNSGAETSELALKLARLHGRRRIVAAEGGFHGKTLGALSITGRERYRAPFEPLLPDVTFVRFGDISTIAEALEHDGEQTVVIIEPVQAEGGVVIPPPRYLALVEHLCRSSGALLVLDEIQTGLGRLGAWWGADREGISPDVLLVGKSLSGGVVPVGAVVATPEVFAPLNRDPLLHTSTFGGSPLAARAAEAAIDAIERDGLVQRADELGRELLAGLRSLLEDYEFVVDVRGAGLLIGVEFEEEHLAGDFMLELLDRKVLVSHSLNSHEVVRLTPPAVLEDEHCSWLFDAVDGAIRSVARRANVNRGEE